MQEQWIFWCHFIPPTPEPKRHSKPGKAAPPRRKEDWLVFLFLWFFPPSAALIFSSGHVYWKKYCKNRTKKGGRATWHGTKIAQPENEGTKASQQKMRRFVLSARPDFRVHFMSTICVFTYPASLYAVANMSHCPSWYYVPVFTSPLALGPVEFPLSTWVASAGQEKIPTTAQSSHKPK